MAQAPSCSLWTLGNVYNPRNPSTVLSHQSLCDPTLYIPAPICVVHNWVSYDMAMPAAFEQCFGNSELAHRCIGTRARRHSQVGVGMTEGKP